MKSELEQVEENDGFSNWRQQESVELSSIVQAALAQLQNPPDCSRAKKLLCHLYSVGSGFGSLIHMGVYCLITAMATERVLIISDKPWDYNNITIKQFFMPVSSSCTSYEGNIILPNPGQTKPEYAVYRF